MKKGTFQYKIRRKLQIIAIRVTSPKFMSKLYFGIVMRKRLNLKDPKTFNEKIQWLKLNVYPMDDRIIKCTDKYLVREFLQNGGYGKYLNQLIGVWDKADEIPFDSLPRKFVLKCNHGCGYNLICNDKGLLDTNSYIRKLEKWMHDDFGLYNAEPHYSKIDKKIICEKNLGTNLTDYKFFCFKGKVHFFYVAKGFGEGKDERMTFFMPDGSLSEFQRRDYPQLEEGYSLPTCLNEMIQISEQISRVFEFVRVDLFQIDGRVIFSELTFTPNGGLMKIYPDKYDLEWGNMIDMSRFLPKKTDNTQNQY